MELTQGFRILSLPHPYVQIFDLLTEKESLCEELPLRIRLNLML